MDRLESLFLGIVCSSINVKQILCKGEVTLPDLEDFSG